MPRFRDSAWLPKPAPERSIRNWKMNGRKVKFQDLKKERQRSRGKTQEEQQTSIYLSGSAPILTIFTSFDFLATPSISNARHSGMTDHEAPGV